MLYITGTFNGETYNEEPIDAKKLRDAFGIPALKKTADIRVVQRRVTQDRFGRTRKPSIRMTTEFEIQDSKGNSFFLRYAERKTKKDGELKYSPSRLTDINGGAAMLPPSKLDKYVFYYLNPACQNSPIAGRNTKYYFHDEEAEALKTLADASLQFQVIDAIRNEAEDALRAKAFALTIKTKGGSITIPDAGSMSDAMLRARMLNLCSQYPSEFVQAWGASADDLIGKLRLAVDRNIIQERKDPSASNMRAYFWNLPDNKDRICVIQSNQKGMEALLREFSAKFNEYYFILSEALNLRDVEKGRAALMGDIANAGSRQEAMKGAFSLGVDELIGQGLARDLVYFDRHTGSVELAGSEEMKVADIQNWRKEYADWLGQDENVERLNALRMRLGHAVSDEKKIRIEEDGEVVEKKGWGRGRPKKDK